MSEFHVRQIAANLSQKFEGLIDMADSESLQNEDRIARFLSRAIGAFVLLHLHQINSEDAAASVVDGYNDNGIDFLYYDRNSFTLTLGQSKWNKDGNGAFTRPDLSALVRGYTDLINLRMHRFNDKIQAKASEVNEALLETRTKLRLVLVHNSTEPLSSHLETDVGDFLQQQNDSSEVATVLYWGQGEVHSAISRGATENAIDVEVNLMDWGKKRGEIQAFYGQVAASDIASWVQQHGNNLFAPNIRMFLGSTDVNDGMLSSLLSEPENFWYYNNGITIICDTLEKLPIGGNSTLTGMFKCRNMQIINGAQTAGAITKAATQSPTTVGNAFVSVRLISLENCPIDFGKHVTKNTNTQNRIENRDFLALDAEQLRVRNELALDQVTYVIKSGETIPQGVTGFDASEAMTALACHQRDVTFSVTAKRNIGALWADTSRTPYTTLFNSNLQGPDLWRRVQILRIMESGLSAKRQITTGRENLLAVHGNRLIAHLVFQRLPAELKNSQSEFGQDKVTQVKNLVDATHQLLFQVTNDLFGEAYLATVFKNLSKCNELKREFMRIINLPVSNADQIELQIPNG